MRCREGDAVRLFNGRDGEWEARIVDLGRRATRCVAERQTRPQDDESDLWLAFALLKRTATDLVVQKATELGASALWPLVTSRTNAGRTNTARLHAIAVEAAEQSERLSVPALHSPRQLAALLADWPGERPLFPAAERPLAPPHAAPTRRTAGAPGGAGAHPGNARGTPRVRVGTAPGTGPAERPEGGGRARGRLGPVETGGAIRAVGRAAGNRARPQQGAAPPFRRS